MELKMKIFRPLRYRTIEKDPGEYFLGKIEYLQDRQLVQHY